jgi:hypothetical protein
MWYSERTIPLPSSGPEGFRLKKVITAWLDCELFDVYNLQLDSVGNVASCSSLRVSSNPTGMIIFLIRNHHHVRQLATAGLASRATASNTSSSASTSALHPAESSPVKTKDPRALIAAVRGHLSQAKAAKNPTAGIYASCFSCLDYPLVGSSHLGGSL